MRNSVRTLVSALAAAVATSSAAQAPPPQPQRTPAPLTFGVGIDVINLNVLVTDGRSRYITNLDQQDFAIFEDGIRQELSLFNHEELPLSVVLLIDTSASMDEKIGAAQTAAIRFVKTFRAQDVGQVVQFNERVTTLQEFTPDQAKLEAAIRRTST